jgi:hypothetical protein
MVWRISASCVVVLAAIGVLSIGVGGDVAGQPSSPAEAVMAWPITISPGWFDPGCGTPLPATSCANFTASSSLEPLPRARVVACGRAQAKPSD